MNAGNFTIELRKYIDGYNLIITIIIMQTELIKVITTIKTWCCRNHYLRVASELLCLFVQITTNKRKAFTENTEDRKTQSTPSS